MEKLNMQTTSIVDENIRRIRELFPNCLTERIDAHGRPQVAIDFDQLPQKIRCALAVKRAWTSTTRRISISRATTCKC